MRKQELDELAEMLLVRDESGQVVEKKCVKEELELLLDGKDIPTLPDLKLPQGLQQLTEEEKTYFHHEYFQLLTAGNTKKIGKDVFSFDLNTLRKYQGRLRNIDPITALELLAKSYPSGGLNIALAFIYMLGLGGREPSQELAREYLERSPDNGEANFILGVVGTKFDQEWNAYPIVEALVPLVSEAERQAYLLNAGEMGYEPAIHLLDYYEWMNEIRLEAEEGIFDSETEREILDEIERHERISDKSPEMLVNLGMAYKHMALFSGKMVSEKRQRYASRSREYLVNAAALGSGEARYRLGHQDYGSKLEWLHSCAYPERGGTPYYPALIDLAEVYADTDLTKALQYINEAIEHDVAEAHLSFARLLMKSPRVAENCSDAIPLKLSYFLKQPDIYSGMKAEAHGWLAGLAIRCDQDWVRAHEHLNAINSNAPPLHKNLRDLALAIGWGEGVNIYSVFKSLEKLIDYANKRGYAYLKDCWLGVAEIQALRTRAVDYELIIPETLDLVEGIIYLCSTPTIDSEQIGKYFGPEKKGSVRHHVWWDMLRVVVGTQLKLVGRTGAIDLDEAQNKLATMDQFFETHSLVSNNVRPHRDWLSKNKASLQKQIDSLKLEEANRQLCTANEDLGRQKKQLEQLMALFAHRFRTPIGIIRDESELDDDERMGYGKSMSRLLELVSLLSHDEKKLRTRLHDDQSGKQNIYMVLYNTLWLGVEHLLSSNSEFDVVLETYVQRKNLLVDERHGNKFTVMRQLTHQWHDELRSLNGQDKHEAFFNWLAEIVPVRIEGFLESSLQFEEHGIKEELLRTVMGELFLNAVRYYDPAVAGVISLKWAKTVDGYEFFCSNPTSEVTRNMTHGSGRGREFLHLLADKVGGELLASENRQIYATSFSFPVTIF